MGSHRASRGVCVLAGAAIAGVLAMLCQVPAASGGAIAETVSFATTLPELRAGAVEPVPTGTSTGERPPFFRLLFARLDATPDDAALTSAGEEAACPASLTCSRLHASAYFTLDDPLAAQRLRDAHVIWCFDVNGATGAINALTGQVECKDPSIYWPEVDAFELGGVLVVAARGSSAAREDFVHETITGIDLSLAVSGSVAPCPPAAAAPELPPGLSVYDAFRQLSPGDERWDLLLRRVERQRAALAKHRATLEDTAYEAVLIWALLPVDVALNLLGGPLLKSIGAKVIRRGGLAAACRVPLGGCLQLLLRALAAGDPCRFAAFHIATLRKLEKQQKILRRALERAEREGLNRAVIRLLELLQRLEQQLRRA